MHTIPYCYKHRTWKLPCEKCNEEYKDRLLKGLGIGSAAGQILGQFTGVTSDAVAARMRQRQATQELAKRIRDIMTGPGILPKCVNEGVLKELEEYEFNEADIRRDPPDCTKEPGPGPMPREQGFARKMLPYPDYVKEPALKEEDMTVAAPADEPNNTEEVKQETARVLIRLLKESREDWRCTEYTCEHRPSGTKVHLRTDHKTGAETLEVNLFTKEDIGDELWLEFCFAFGAEMAQAVFDKARMRLEELQVHLKEKPKPYSSNEEFAKKLRDHAEEVGGIVDYRSKVKIFDGTGVNVHMNGEPYDGQGVVFLNGGLVSHDNLTGLDDDAHAKYQTGGPGGSVPRMDVTTGTTAETSDICITMSGTPLSKSSKRGDGPLGPHPDFTWDKEEKRYVFNGFGNTGFGNTPEKKPTKWAMFCNAFWISLVVSVVGMYLFHSLAPAKWAAVKEWIAASVFFK